MAKEKLGGLGDFAQYALERYDKTSLEIIRYARHCYCCLERLDPDNELLRVLDRNRDFTKEFRKKYRELLKSREGFEGGIVALDQFGKDLFAELIRTGKPNKPPGL